LYRGVVARGRTEYLLRLAYAVKAHGGVGEAKQAFERCVEADVKPVTALMNLGFMAERAGALAEAATYYERAMAAGGVKEAPACLARMLAGGLRDAEVPGLYRLAIQSREPNAAVLLARRLWSAGEMDELEHLYSCAVAWGREDLRVELACVLHELGPAREASAPRSRTSATPPGRVAFLSRPASGCSGR